VTLILNQAHRYTLNANDVVVREVLDALAQSTVSQGFICEIINKI